jgi:hypothetical protein
MFRNAVILTMLVTGTRAALADVTQLHCDYALVNCTHDLCGFFSPNGNVSLLVDVSNRRLKVAGSDWTAMSVNQTSFTWQDGRSTLTRDTLDYSHREIEVDGASGATTATADFKGKCQKTQNQL